MAEGADDGPKVDYMAITVFCRDGAREQIENIDGWEIDGDKNLRVRRRTVEVAVYSDKYWTNIDVSYRLTDGSTINKDGDTGPPTDVGMGVTATAIGGRTA